MKLIETFKKSVYSPEFYKELREKPLSFSIKYFYSLALIVGIILAVLFSVNAVPAARSFFEKIEPEIDKIFPYELVVKIEKGKASANVLEPYFMAVPDSLKSENGNSDKPKIENILVIDTKTPFSLEKFQEYKTIALLTGDSIAFMDENKGVSIRSLDDFPDTTIDKPLVVSLVKKIEPFGKWLVPIIVFGSFVVSLALLTGKLTYLLLGALIVWLLASVKKIKLNYKQSFKIAVHASSLGVVFYAFNLLFFPPAVKYLFTALLIVSVWLNLSSKSSEISKPESPSLK